MEESREVQNVEPADGLECTEGSYGSSFRNEFEPSYTLWFQEYRLANLLILSNYGTKPDSS